VLEKYEEIIIHLLEELTELSSLEEDLDLLAGSGNLEFNYEQRMCIIYRSERKKILIN
jgi:hypothetical protein